MKFIMNSVTRGVTYACYVEYVSVYFLECDFYFTNLHVTFLVIGS
jgi:hypothetical protein